MKLKYLKLQSINDSKIYAEKTYRRHHTIGKDNVVYVLSSVLVKTIFNIRERRTNFKLTYQG